MGHFFEELAQLGMPLGAAQHQGGKGSPIQGMTPGGWGLEEPLGPLGNFLIAGLGFDPGPEQPGSLLKLSLFEQVQELWVKVGGWSLAHRFSIERWG